MVLTLKVFIKQNGVTKTLQFDPSCTAYDACRLIREKMPEATQGQGSVQEYSLFLSDKDQKRGVWLESRRPLEYYLLRDGDVLEYKSKQRPMKIQTLDGSVKTVRIDDSNTVEQLMITICTKLAISNYEEYSLVRETQDEEDPNTKKETGSLLKPSAVDRKFETMKKRLHTDDELNWLNHGQTLREQGVDDMETLILRRKYFYSDQNVDSRDPIQLNLLYVQSRDGIIKGQYPVNEKDAVTFAALQCQVQLGNHDERKHKPGYLDLKDYLPKEYVKNRGIEKKIFSEHKLLEGMKELDSKARYTKNCRELKTYGVAFFLVKEKMKGKNKLAPRLLGITRESVLRLDERTKDIMKVWPLTSVKRWAASPKSFTLDFGDYQDGYYSVQTTEGEQIAQIISGYIDIILKKRQAKDNVLMGDDEDSSIMEEDVSARKAQMVGAHGSSFHSLQLGSVLMPGVIGSTASKPSSYSMGAMQPVAHAVTQGNISYGGKPLNPSQLALMGNIAAAFTACQAAQQGFTTRTDLPPLGSDAAAKQWRINAIEENKHNIESNLAAINAAAAAMLLWSTGNDVDLSAVGAAVATITSSLNDMRSSVGLMSALIDDVGAQNMMKAAMNLSTSISDLLRSVQPGSDEPRKNAVDAVGRIGDASRLILSCIGSDTDEHFQDVLNNLAKKVALTTSAVLMQAKSITGSITDPAHQQQLATSATHCAQSTSELVASAKLLAPTISNRFCQDQLVGLSREVSQNVDGCLEAAKLATSDPNLLHSLGLAASDVGNALDDLVKYIQQGAAGPKGKYDDHCEIIINATNKLCSSMGDASVMVKQARLLAKTTSELVGILKLEADDIEDDEQKKRLLGAAKMLADATGKMVEAARGAATNPNDSQQQENLKAAAENLRSATNAATQNALRKKLINHLENLTQQAAVTATQTIIASNAAEAHISNKATYHPLASHAKTLQQDHVPRLLRAVRESRDNPDAAAAHLNLVTTANEFLTPGVKMVSLSKAVIPTVSDHASASNLAGSTKRLTLALSDLKNAAAQAAEMCGPSGIEAAIETLQNLNKQLYDYCTDARDHRLQPLPGQDMKTCAEKLGASSKVVGATMAQLLTAAAQGNEDYTCMAARDLANALQTLVEAARGVAAHLPDLDSKLNLLENSRELINHSDQLLQEAQVAVQHPGNPDSRQKMAKMAKAVTKSLANCVACLPGQKEVNQALINLGQASKRLLADHFPPSSANFQALQSSLNQAAEELNIAANELVGAARGSPTELAASSDNYNQKFTNLLDTGISLAGQWKDKDDQRLVVEGLKSVSMASSKLLLAAKALSADPGAPNVKNQLAAAARAVTESINNLITQCTQSNPGQKACDNALRQIETIKELLENPNEPVSDYSYFDCLDGVIDKSKQLGVCMNGITQHARSNELESFGTSVTSSQKALIAMTEAAAQAAYLVGIADPNSEAGTPGLVDQSQFARANQAIQMACQSISDPSSSQSQILSAATVVAKHTSALCNVCKVASNKTNNDVAKKHFIQSAKEVALATGNLVKTVKGVDLNFSKPARAACTQAAAEMGEAVENLTAFVSNPEFSSVPAKISDEAREAQKPIAESGMMVLGSSTDMIKSARKLANNPKDRPTWQTMQSQSRVVSEAIKKLINSIRENAPGQKECDQAIGAINQAIKELNDASLFAMDQTLQPSGGNSLQGFQTTVVDAVNQISNCIDPIAAAARSDAAQLGRQVAQMASYFAPLASASIGAASNSSSHQRQMDILDYSKTLAESALQLMYAAKEGGGNPKADNAHEAIDEAVTTSKEAVDDLLKSAQEAPEALMSGLIDSISNSAQLLDRPVADTDEGFASYQTRIAGRCRAILVKSSDMGMAMNNRPEDLGGLAKKVAQEYAALTADGAHAAALADSPEVKSHIKKSIQGLGDACKELMSASGQVQSDPRNIHAKKGLTEAGRNVKEKVSFVMSSLQQGGRGTQACITAHTHLQGLIGDLDTTLMFVSSGALNTETDGGSFSDHREMIFKSAKILVEDAKLLVQSAGGGQEKLASSAQAISSTFESLVDAVKLGATSLGANDADTQAMLITAVRDVASSLSDLINATKNAAGKPASDSSMNTLKDSAKVTVGNVTSLLKTVKSVGDEATKGTRALEQTVASINQELKSADDSGKRATPEELIQITKPITSATAKAVAAGKSCRQEDMVACANMGRKAVFDMIQVCRASAAASEDQSQKEIVLKVGKSVAQAYAALLSNVLAISQQPSNNQLKSKLGPLSKDVATAVSQMVKTGETMKGSDWVDPNDPNVIAEQELLAAAASIEAAAKKLALLRPRKKPKQVDDTLNFEEQILEAAKSIATATTALVKAASAAQKELVLQGKVGAVAALRHDDGQWSQGLISAAQLVARSTGNLCEAANQAVQGEASEEKLVTSAKQVASSTAQLLVACQVKADPNSENMKRLQTAGSAVKKAAQSLVESAKDAAFQEAEEEEQVSTSGGLVGSIRDEMEAMEKILAKEKELKEAQEKLKKLRAKKYDSPKKPPPPPGKDEVKRRMKWPPAQQ